MPCPPSPPPPSGPPPPPGATPPPPPPVTPPADPIQALRAKAKEHELAGLLDEARSLLLEAWAHVEQQGHDSARADLAHSIASFLRFKLNRPDEAEPFARHAVHFEEKCGRPTLLGNHLMFLSSLLSEQDRAEEALACAERALPCYQVSHGEMHTEVAYIHSVLASLYAQRGRGDEASAHHARCEAIMEQARSSRK